MQTPSNQSKLNKDSLLKDMLTTSTSYRGSYRKFCDFIETEANSNNKKRNVDINIPYLNSTLYKSHNRSSLKAVTKSANTNANSNINTITETYIDNEKDCDNLKSNYNTIKVSSKSNTKTILIKIKEAPKQEDIFNTESISNDENDMNNTIYNSNATTNHNTLYNKTFTNFNNKGNIKKADFKSSMISFYKENNKVAYTIDNEFINKTSKQGKARFKLTKKFMKSIIKPNNTLINVVSRMKKLNDSHNYNNYLYNSYNNGFRVKNKKSSSGIVIKLKKYSSKNINSSQLSNKCSSKEGNSNSSIRNYQNYEMSSNINMHLNNKVLYKNKLSNKQANKSSSNSLLKKLEDNNKNTKDTKDYKDSNNNYSHVLNNNDSCYLNIKKRLNLNAVNNIEKTEKEYDITSKNINQDSLNNTNNLNFDNTKYFKTNTNKNINTKINTHTLTQTNERNSVKTCKAKFTNNNRLLNSSDMSNKAYYTNREKLTSSSFKKQNDFHIKVMNDKKLINNDNSSNFKLTPEHSGNILYKIIDNACSNNKSSKNVENKEKNENNENTCKITSSVNSFKCFEVDSHIIKDENAYISDIKNNIKKRTNKKYNTVVNHNNNVINRFHINNKNNNNNLQFVKKNIVSQYSKRNSVVSHNTYNKFNIVSGTNTNQLKRNPSDLTTIYKDTNNTNKGLASFRYNKYNKESTLEGHLNESLSKKNYLIQNSINSSSSISYNYKNNLNSKLNNSHLPGKIKLKYTNNFNNLKNTKNIINKSYNNKDINNSNKKLNINEIISNVSINKTKSNVLNLFNTHNLNKQDLKHQKNTARFSLNPRKTDISYLSLLQNNSINTHKNTLETIASNHSKSYFNNNTEVNSKSNSKNYNIKTNNKNKINNNFNTITYGNGNFNKKNITNNIFPASNRDTKNHNTSNITNNLLKLNKNKITIGTNTNNIKLSSKEKITFLKPHQQLSQHTKIKIDRKNIIDHLKSELQEINYNQSFASLVSSNSNESKALQHLINYTYNNSSSLEKNNNSKDNRNNKTIEKSKLDNTIINKSSKKILTSKNNKSNDQDNDKKQKPSKRESIKLKKVKLNSLSKINNFLFFNHSIRSHIKDVYNYYVDILGKKDFNKESKEIQDITDNSFRHILEQRLIKIGSTLHSPEIKKLQNKNQVLNTIQEEMKQLGYRIKLNTKTDINEFNEWKLKNKIETDKKIEENAKHAASLLEEIIHEEYDIDDWSRNKKYSLSHYNEKNLKRVTVVRNLLKNKNVKYMMSDMSNLNPDVIKQDKLKHDVELMYIMRNQFHPKSVKDRFKTSTISKYKGLSGFHFGCM